jgi:acyl-CoA synthetase (AMP-forming)/AMP-acid ligase II
MRLYPDARVAGFLADGWWSGQTWLDLLAGHVRDRPDTVSLVDPANRAELFGGQPRRLTWRDVDAEVTALARALHRSGVRADDVVGVQLPNCVELAVAYLAVARLGAITCAFPVQYAEHELTQMGTMAGLRALVTTERVGRSRLAEQAARLDLPSLSVVLSWGVELPAGVRPLDRELAGEDGDAAYRDYVAALELHPNDCVTLCWTSGTEGVPKGVPRAHGDWQAIALGTISTPRLTPDDVLLNPFPMVNAGGMAGMFLPWLMLGARLVQHHPFDLEVFLAQIEDERVTYTCAPPAVLNTLVASPEALAAHDISSLRAVGSGSAPLSAWMIEAWERDRGVEVLNLFGSNEGLCLFGCPDTVPDPADRGRLFPQPLPARRPGDRRGHHRAGTPGRAAGVRPDDLRRLLGRRPATLRRAGLLLHRRRVRVRRRRRAPAGVPGPGQGPDQPRWLQGLGRRDRIAPPAAPAGRRGGPRRHPRRPPRRAHLRGRRAAGGRRSTDARLAARPPTGAARRPVQVARAARGGGRPPAQPGGEGAQARAARTPAPDPGSHRVTAPPVLRQVVLLAADLDDALRRARELLGLNPGVRDADGMAALGFEHEVLAIEETFVEIVHPLAADSPAGRVLARRGECGFMVALQVPSLDDVLVRAAAIGLAPVMHTTYEGNPISQWHPRDLGTLAELDEMRTAEWHLLPELAATGSTAVVDDVVAVEIEVPDPAGCAARWGALLGVPVDDGASALDLDGRRVEFRPGEGGLVAVRLAGRAARVDTLCGVRIEIMGTES